MGIRFRCHHCQFELHVKDFQGGKRGKCPQCSGKFRVPAADSDFSMAIEDSVESDQGNSSDRVLISAVESADPVVTLSHKIENKIESQVQTFSSKNDPLVKNDTTASQPDTPQAPPSPQISANSLAALRESPNSLWHVRPPSGGQYGPVGGDIFLQWINERRVTGDSLVWREGWPEWLVAANVFHDYFDSNLTISTAPSSSVKSSLPASPVVAARNLKKKRANKRYLWMIGILGVLAIMLVIALIVVLLIVPAGTSQPAP